MKNNKRGNGNYVPNPDGTGQMRRRIDDVGLGDLALALTSGVDRNGNTRAATGADGRCRRSPRW